MIFLIYSDALTSSSHTFTIAKVSSSQYFRRLWRAVRCSSGAMSLILGKTVMASFPLCTPSRLW